MTDIRDVQAIDVHAHYGSFPRGISELVDRLRTCDAQGVVERAGLAHVALTIVSPSTALAPRFEADAVAGNDEAERTVAEVEGLRRWVVVNPLQPGTYEQAAAALGQSLCVGIKIHPEEHGYAICEHGGTIFEFAAEHRAVVLTHSGEPHSMPEDYVRFADAFARVTLILAHLGHGSDGDPTHQVRAIEAARQGNIYADTSSAQNITPGLLEWAVEQVGPERLLFGTDSPVYWAPMQRARIDSALIEDAAKRLILRDNALRLLELNLEE